MKSITWLQIKCTVFPTDGTHVSLKSLVTDDSAVNVSLPLKNKIIPALTLHSSVKNACAFVREEETLRKFTLSKRICFEKPGQACLILGLVY